MKLVLDASVAVRWVVTSPLTPKALRLRNGYRQAIHKLIAPFTFSAEVASGLTKSERQKLIPSGQAEVLLFKVLGTSPVIHPYDPLLHRATVISSHQERLARLSVRGTRRARSMRDGDRR